jgi:lipid II:glycine glycyltransferase (peptidoglycan interpeptide bridge formation enzyme)
MLSGQFLQSNEWAEFQKSLGRKVWIINDTLVIKMSLVGRFNFLYSPKGPTEITNEVIAEIKKIAAAERAVFWRVEPATTPQKNFIKTKNIQPATTQVLDLSKSEEILLSEMHPKTRYNIRLAERKGVTIANDELRTANDNSDIFYNLLKETAERQNIKLHSKQHYEKLAAFNRIFIAYYNNQPIAGAMVNFHNNVATYLHGGSTQEHKEVMAPYLLHWEIIKAAKSTGNTHYDWWGVDEKKWPGITRFKKSFGGEEITSPGTYDLPINRLIFKLYGWRRRLRKS